jgi:hypothetical protein
VSGTSAMGNGRNAFKNLFHVAALTKVEALPQYPPLQHLRIVLLGR